MTRLWLSGEAIEMWLDGGQPIRFRWAGRSHPVTEICARWRLDVGWWRLRIWRDYFTLTTATGLLAEVYHDRLRECWFLQRVFD